LTTAEADISEITASGKPTALFLNSPSTSCTHENEIHRAAHLVLLLPSANLLLG
jgi:hypothetical protein